MPILATSGMIGRRLHAGRNPPASFLRSELNDLYQSACAVGAIVSRAESAICANCNQLITGYSLHSVIVSCRSIGGSPLPEYVR